MMQTVFAIVALFATPQGTSVMAYNHIFETQEVCTAALAEVKEKVPVVGGVRVLSMECVALGNTI